MGLRPLRVLLVEDSQDDAILLTRELRRSGFQPEVARVENARAMISSLIGAEWDVVIADYHLPDFSVLEALAILHEREIDIPFIVVSGAVADETAVIALRAGADDFIPKGSWARLGPAIERELGEAGNRRERRRAESALRFQAEASKRLAESLDYTEIGAMAAHLVVPFLGDWCSVLIQDKTGAASSLAVAGPDSSAKSEFEEFARERGIARDWRTSRAAGPDPRPVFVSDLWAADLPSELLDREHLYQLRELGAHSFLATPLVARGRVIGSMNLVRTDSRRRLTAADQIVAEDLAQRVALAVDNALLYAAERVAHREAQILAERISRLQAITAKIAGAVSVEEVTRTIVAAGIAAGEADAAFVGLRAADGDELEVMAHSGYSADVRKLLEGEWRHVSLDFDAPFVEAIRTGRLVALASDAARARRYPNLPSFDYQAVVAVPLRVEHRSIGVLVLSFADAREFELGDLQYLDTLADQCAQALERARLYESERRAVRLRDEFVSVAAHELRTPLTGLALQAQIVERRLRHSRTIVYDEEMEAWRSINRQAAKASDLINRLLDVSRIEGGQLTIDRQLTDIGDLVERVAQIMAERASRPSILTVTRSPGPIPAVVDELRLEQVITNVIDNALKYTPIDGKIDVEIAYSSAETVEICVTDTGLGIPPERREKIFERFYRAHENSHQSGLGLGLFICRHIVELHGGTIRAEFPNDRGSRFVIVLPTGAPAELTTVASRDVLQ